MVKDPPTNTRDTGNAVSILGSGRSSGEGNWQPGPYCSWEIHGQKSLGFSPCDLKESDTIEHTHIEILDPIVGLSYAFKLC